MAKNSNQLKRVCDTLRHEIVAVRNLEKILKDPIFNRSIRAIGKRKGKILTVGVGKSSFLAMKMAATLTSLGHPTFFLHPVEAMHGDTGVVSDGDIVIAFSFSGESLEVVNIIKYFKRTFDIKIVSITGDKTSSLAKLSAYPIVIKVKNEGSPLGIAPMASTTASLVVSDLIASGLTSELKFKKQHFAKYHPGGSLGLSLMFVKDYMSTKVPSVEENTPFKNALSEITKGGFGFTGVLDSKGVLKGVITDGDIRRFLLKEKDITRAIAVDLMSNKPKVVHKNDSLKDALGLLEQFKVTNLFVIDNKMKPIGVIHMHDIVG